MSCSPRGSPSLSQQWGPEGLLLSLPVRAWPDPSLPELPAPLQGDCNPSNEDQTRIKGSFPNATHATRAPSSVRVSMTCGHVTRWHRGCHPGRACTESSKKQPNPWGASLCPSLPQPWLRVTFDKAPSQGTAGTREPLAVELCHRSQTGSGAILRPAGLSAAARSSIIDK